MWEDEGERERRGEGAQGNVGTSHCCHDGLNLPSAILTIMIFAPSVVHGVSDWGSRDLERECVRCVCIVVYDCVFVSAFVYVLLVFFVNVLCIFV